jgi:hypothetical protein
MAAGLNMKSLRALPPVMKSHNCILTALYLIAAAFTGLPAAGEELIEPEIRQNIPAVDEAVRLEPRAEADPVNFIGMSIAELIENFGPPDSVYPSRGIETWQDDVVFEYPGVDFYIYKDKVWQLSLDAGHGISRGDPSAAVMLVLGDTARDNEKYILGKLQDTSWPVEWRFNIEDGKVSAIYLYRMDY